MYKLKDLPKFRKQYRKFSSKDQEEIRKEIRKIVNNPLIGELKKGPLSKVRVHKWKLKHQLYLIAYELENREKTIYLYALATHEGFYKALERYI